VPHHPLFLLAVFTIGKHVAIGKWILSLPMEKTFIELVIAKIIDMTCSHTVMQL